MGICGLGLSWRVAAQVLGAPHAIGEALIALAAALFVVLGTIYVLKLFNAPDAVAAEFRNPTTSSQFGSLTIALLLLAVGILPYAPRSALAIWSAGAAGQCLLFLTLLDRWISEPTELGNATPSWLIPIVGNVTATFAGVPLGFPEISWFLFAVGLVFWLTFLPLLLNRLIFHHEPLPGRSAPTLALLVASPAVICLAWLQLTGRVDETYRIILFVALFFVLLVLRLWRLAAHSPISVTWWTYTFPSAALATAVVRYRQQVLGPGPAVLAWGALGMASVVVATVTVASLGSLLATRRPALRVRQVDELTTTPGGGGVLPRRPHKRYAEKSTPESDR
jgi:tellurite resistance protein